MNGTFDHEWRIEELLDEADLTRVGTALTTLAGNPVAIADRDGKILWGKTQDVTLRTPLVLELEPVGYLLGIASEYAQQGAGSLMEFVLRTMARYKMAANLHLETVATDFETLRLEHARLQESESRYRTLAGELENRVAAQVTELEERQQMLYEAERLASVGQLAAGVAHEVNNPLGFVRSNLSSFQLYLNRFSELKQHLGEGERAWKQLDLDFILEDGKDLLSDTIGGIDRIAKIVGELKSFSNVDRASEEYADINDSLRHAASVMEGLLPAGASLHLSLAPLPKFVCLPGHLNQALLGLMLNAGQAIDDTGHPGEISVSSFTDGTTITVRIQDNGVGMTPEQLARAFEPFYTTRPVGSGAGLGLTTARNIVLAHSGHIDLESTPNAGTTVILSFPVHK